MAILDQFGRPVAAQSFPERERLIATSSQVQRWADHSVGTGLTPERLAQILRDNDTGETEDMQTLAVEMEERDPHYWSQLSTRKLAVTGAPIRVEPPMGSGTKGEEIAKAWETQVCRKPSFRWLLADLMDALGQSFSVVQPIPDTTTRPWSFKKFKHFDCRSFMWDRDRLETLRVRDEGNPDGRELPRGLLIHLPRIRTGLPLRGGIARLAAVTYLFKVHTVADWLTFAEVYGMPIRLGRYGPDATDTEKEMLAQAVINLGHDAAAIMPTGMSVEFVDARRPTSGDNLYQGVVNYFDECLSKAINGITTAGDAKARGIGTGEGDLHRETRQDIVEHDALTLGATIGTLAAWWTAINYGEGAPVPETTLDVAPPENKDSKAERFDKVAGGLVKMRQVGYTVSKEELSEQFDISVEDAPEPEPVEPGGEPGGEDKPEPGRAPNAALPEPLEFAEDEAESLISNWQEVLGPHLAALESAANAASDYQDLDARLRRLASSVDSDPLVQALAKAAMRARGVANA